jgi:5,10-methylenetetrahydromethanopterin reductase
MQETPPRDPGPAPGTSIGLALTGTQSWPTVRDWATRVDRVDGVTNLWVFDERFGRDPWVTLGQLAATTQHVTLGTCVTDPFIRHPALTAAAIATVADATGGRAVLGLGAGVSGFRALGISREAPATALREAIGFIRAFWASPTDFDHVGTTLRFSGSRLHFGPVAPIPIMVAARGPRILALAGELADQVLVATFTDGPLLDQALAHLESGIAKRAADRPPIRRGTWTYVSIDPDREAARDAVREGIAVALYGSRPILDELGIELPSELRSLMDSTTYAMTPEIVGRAAELVPDELIDVCSIAGRPDEVLARFRGLAERGFDHIAVWPFAPAGRPLGSVIELLVDEVVPGLAAATASTGEGRTT